LRQDWLKKQEKKNAEHGLLPNRTGMTLGGAPEEVLPASNAPEAVMTVV
jgi:hypothetical protein